MTWQDGVVLTIAAGCAWHLARAIRETLAGKPAGGCGCDKPCGSSAAKPLVQIDLGSATPTTRRFDSE